LAVCVIGIPAVVFVRSRLRAHEAPPAPPVEEQVFEPANTGDAVAAYLRQLANGTTFAERRDAVISRGNLGDRTALKALRRARSPKGFARLRACMKRDELENAIRSLERQAP